MYSKQELQELRDLIEKNGISITSPGGMTRKYLYDSLCFYSHELYNKLGEYIELLNNNELFSDYDTNYPEAFNLIYGDIKDLPLLMDKKAYSDIIEWRLLRKK